MKPKKKEVYIYIKRKWCKRCNFCVTFCPKKVYDIDNKGNIIVANIENCNECGLCVALCPDFAIITDPEVTMRLKEW